MKIIKNVTIWKAIKKLIGVVKTSKDVIIETDWLILRQYRLEDADDIVEGLNNLNVSKWLAGAPYPYTKEDALKFIN